MFELQCSTLQNSVLTNTYSTKRNYQYSVSFNGCQGGGGGGGGGGGDGGGGGVFVVVVVVVIVI
jgi:hypothetical protein